MATIEKPYKFIPKALELPSDIYEILTTEVDFKRGTLSTYGRTIEERRSMAWQTSVGVECTYGGKIMPPIPFTQTVLMIKAQIEAITGVEFDSVLCFMYETGRDSMGFHKDDVGVSRGKYIAGITIGATRTLAIRDNVTKEKERFEVGHGDMFCMFDDCQDRYMHSIEQLKPSDPEPGVRIALTFRQMRIIS